MKLTGRHALVVGLGKSGVAAARLLLSRGARVIAADDAQVALPRGVPELRRVAPDALEGIDLVVASPGVPLSLPIFAEARARGIELCGEVELASRFIEEPIAGITGTNGKSTTTALTGHLLAEAGLRVFTGGNLGNALSNRVLEGGALDATVCELSSYQLEGIAALRCAAATVLNVTPDHLDRYPDLDAYAAAKARIFANQRAGDTAAINAADARVRAMETNPGVRRAEFDPREPLRIEGTPLQLRAATLRGAHNRENAFAACLLARHFGVGMAALQRGLDGYPGLPHRLEPVRVLDGVEWVNDSKATNVDSVEKSLTAFPGNLHIIMGGRGKGAPYAPLRAPMRGKVKTILTVGEDAEKIAAELGDLAPVVAAQTLPAAVKRARELARPGDVVLLSPACASYDQFRNFEDRGDQFKALVRGLS
ncbi:MAG TPA: UDP-N-acetylmuramoyl-L-alanine--D-glutamate ligase [Myxococcales bacterium]|nr:UDP-N-acetylmuramoyl-L-alanine--D-glutamate ligase [Myxococcales bacterium]